MADRPMLDERDLDAIRRQGLDAQDAAWQLEHIRRGPRAIALERPATVGDGIERAAGREADLEAAGRRAAAAGRCSFFVPASGAATRMFQDLIGFLEGGSAEPEARHFVEELPRFAFHPALAAALERRGLALDRLRAAGEVRAIVAALLEPEGLDFARLPKALVPFHRGPGGPRTALEEHFEDAAALIADEGRTCRLHFTVSPEHEARLAALVRERAAAIGRHARVAFEWSFSTQSPATDCLAATPDGGPFRDEAGQLVFRPGGHGALLANLAGCGGDLVFVKNVDNVQAPAHKQGTYQWVPRVLGRLAELEGEVRRLLERLDDPGDAEAARDALDFSRRVFHRPPPPEDRAGARALLDRPLRVCGMVPNTGEPGGGPFWVRQEDGTQSLQIVEAAQVAPGQRGIFQRGSHFNPVFLACALRDGRGRPHDLARFVEPEAVIVTRKSAGGRELLALERPGLWNGAMARWNTVFLEVPIEVFTPVKTVFDLLRSPHQTGSQ